MSFERPIKIREAVDNIHRKRYVLPAIQREFVWEHDQIEILFDSLMRGYPIGSFLFWWVEPENIGNYQFYEFVREFHERDNRHNPKASVSGEAGITAILDGQQRLTALYLALRGSYAAKLPRKRWENDLAFPKKELFLNLLAKSEDYDLEYDFRFLTREEAAERSARLFWFKVGDILDMTDTYELNEYLIEQDLSSAEKTSAKFANRTLFRLHKLIHDEEVINYFMEKDESLDKVLNIFIRVNSGGTKLSYSDLLLSIATAQWKERDAREEITSFVDEINNIGDGFGFSKDLVLKACLVLSDFSDIKFKVDNFNTNNMITIEQNWEAIARAIRSAVILVDSFGFHRDTLTSNNALIPIAYYLYRIGSPPTFAEAAQYQEDREKVLRWLIISLLKRSFGGVPDDVFRRIRQTIANHYPNGFPLKEITNTFRATTKSLTFNDEEIDNLLNYKYEQSYTFSTLALLYPTLDFRNRFHIDHIFPKKLFTRKKLQAAGINEADIDSYLDGFNRLVNLQLLEGIHNQEKSGKDFQAWVQDTFPNEADRRDYMRKHYIPDIDLSLGNFREFVTQRAALLTDAFRQLLSIGSGGPAAESMPVSAPPLAAGRGLENQREHLSRTTAVDESGTVIGLPPPQDSVQQPDGLLVDQKVAEPVQATPSDSPVIDVRAPESKGRKRAWTMEEAPKFLSIYNRCDTHTQGLFDALIEAIYDVCPDADTFFTDKPDCRVCRSSVFALFTPIPASRSIKGELITQGQNLLETETVEFKQRAHSSPNKFVQQFHIKSKDQLDEVALLVLELYEHQRSAYPRRHQNR